MQCNISCVFPVSGTGSSIQTPKCHLKKRTLPVLGSDPKCKKPPVSDTPANDTILMEKKSKAGGSTGRLPGGGNLTGWRRVAGFGASLGQIGKVLAEHAVNSCQKGKVGKHPWGVVLDAWLGSGAPV